MKRTRDSKTPFFAAAFYACACLLVYGTVAAAHVRHPAAETSIRLRQQQPQLCCDGRAIVCDSARDFASVSRPARSSFLFAAMLSTVIAAEQNIPRQFEDVREPLPLRERHAIRYPILSSAAHCALLSRQLADA